MLKTTDGKCVGRRGIWAGRALDLGPTCAPDRRHQRGLRQPPQQCADPVFFEMHGLDIAAARAVVVRSRSHFRGGFDGIFAGRVIEVDTRGSPRRFSSVSHSRACRARSFRSTPTRHGRRARPS